MAKCEHCGFPHAIPVHCSNCGSGDPLPSRKLLRLAAVVFGVILLLALASIPVSLYLQRREALKEFPEAPPAGTPTPVP